MVAFTKKKKNKSRIFSLLHKFKMWDLSISTTEQRQESRNFPAVSENCSDAILVVRFPEVGYGIIIRPDAGASASGEDDWKRTPPAEREAYGGWRQLESEPRQCRFALRMGGASSCGIAVRFPHAGSAKTNRTGCKHPVLFVLVETIGIEPMTSTMST